MSFDARSTGERVNVAVLPFLSQRYAVRAAQLIASTPSEMSRDYDDMVREVHRQPGRIVHPGRRQRGDGAPDRHRRHVRRRRAGRAVDLRIQRAGHRLPGRGALRRVGSPAPPADPARAVPRRLQRGAVRRRLRRAGQHPRGLPGAGHPDAPPPRSPTFPITAGRRLRTVHGTVAELVARADEFGDDFLRVYVREPTSAGLRETITDALPNALEVRIDPEFAVAVNPARPTVNHADRSPGELFAEYCASVGVVDDRVQALFAQLHDRITSTGSRG